MDKILVEEFEVSVVAHIINDILVDIAQDFVESAHGYSNRKREDPLLAFAWGILDDLVSDFSLWVARLAVSEAAEEILLEKRCRIARDALEDEIIIEALLTPPPTPQPVGRPRKALQSSHSYLAGVFEEALAEENEAQAVLALVEEVVQLEVRVVCAETLGSYQLDAALASRERAREVVERTALNVICPRLLLSHLLMGVAQRHGAVMLEFLATETIARRIVLERLVLMLDAEEQAIDLVCDDGAIGRFFSDASIPSVQNLLVPLFISASRELEDSIAALEEQYISKPELEAETNDVYSSL